ncbi:hypothetical protein JYK14_02960 [Siccirubricoccus sp. KC 17139]|uniref:Uncharacterized protein n=1 Tax=Siccirubricoccus soli TaxID=2899147 RepID=A0ABT1CZR8_9PROT|nr:hypothetical protein [Siccirubricoccus soli]MCO6415137.1 hypothetical protein [Siccirubricoccus soli]MCP2681268.1 hypothetical protein [Siccirubricoccus soli]
MTEIGPYSRPAALRAIDGRRREARLMAAVRRDLTAHVGGAPSATQRLLIDRCAQLSLHLALMDSELAAGKALGEAAGRQYLAWTNSLSRALRQLGLKEAPRPSKTLQQHIAERRQ